MRFDHLIIGGGVAGHAAAEAICVRDANATIAIIGNERHPLYSRVLLPHVVRGRIEEEKVFLRKPSFYEEKGIEYLSGRAVMRVDSAAKVVILDDGAELSYGTLLIATGGTPTTLDVPGAAIADVAFFQTFEDAQRLRDLAGGEAVVIGGGFIALEFVMSFVKHGIPVTAAMRGDCFFSRALDPDSQKLILDELTKRGVQTICRTAVKGIEAGAAQKTVFLADGQRISCQHIGVGIGLTANVGFLRGSGVRTNAGILADEFLRTSAPDVFTAGDVAEFFDVHTQTSRIVGNWTNASIQGKIVGASMAGELTKFDLVTSYTINCFTLPIAFFGATSDGADERIVRHTPQGAVMQFLVKNDRVIGVTCVGAMSDRQAVVELLTSQKPLNSSEKSALADATVPLSTTE